MYILFENKDERKMIMKRVMEKRNMMSVNSDQVGVLEVECLGYWSETETDAAVHTR
jgi:hypothetical protein